MIHRMSILPRNFGRFVAAMAVLATLAVMGPTPSARAAIVFDPTGTGNPAMPPAFNIQAFDPTLGNSLAFASVPLTLGETFTVYFQATIPTFIAAGGATVNAPAGHEFTILAAFTEQVTTLADTNGNGFNDFARFTSVSNPALTFVEIFDDTTPDANNLQGTGFNDPGSILVLKATPNAGSTGSFAVDETSTGPVVTTFDQNGANDFPNTQTVQGRGSTGLTATVDPSTVNPNYFVGGVPSSITFNLDFSTENVTPFLGQDPSYRFTSLMGTGSPNLFNVNYVGGGTIPYSLGPINGLGGGAINQSFQFRTDASVTINAVGVPEPGTISMALAGIGLASLGMIRKHRQS